MQHTNINTKKKKQTKSPIKKGMLNCFLIVFALTFFLQQLQVFALISNAYNNKTNTNKSTSISHATGTHFLASLTYPSSLELMEMEETEDEDIQSNHQELNNNFSQKYNTEELAYNCILQSRYLQLATSIHQQQAIPYFILYHSWKNYLS